MPEVEAGRVYLCVTCRACGEPTPYMEVKETSCAVHSHGHLAIRCARQGCGHRGRYQPTELRMMKAHLMQ